ncbi:MAG: hypothetical protein A2306_05155 [Omnitrophica WOR_2 bacterium RIFOXYB2_FULL_38_16]|uniref:DUF2061 domain-containing protein n=1 Tax=Candidatus Uhrbacteria bacterium GW2011_GWF2_41_16 TaxID=1618997 RepID=A0A0G0VAH5_9BACT|nr:MAG: hypothetical protein UU48_C0029G0001 [Candidatus Uhrbacteria bacterium GW2011_GWF2_41_16]OGX59707.1 MAG: hypothetical protein A2306_05155 [Omnitrophica WOR_2 bacterium RIFOXYB2_FULL_38_16]
METQSRTLTKTISWRIVALGTTIIVVYLYSGDAKESLVIGVVANAIKMALYYMHERIWNRIDFGRIKRPEYQI